MKRFFLILISFKICLATFGQFDFGIKVTGGLSKITANRYLSNTTSKYFFVPSGQVGFFYNRNFLKKSIIGADLLLSEIRGKEEMKSSYNLGGPALEFGISNLNYRIFYLSFPIYYGFKIKSFTINLGTQTSLALASRATWISKRTYNGSIINTEGNGKLNIDLYDFGPRVMLTFNFLEKFAIEATYYYGINNIMSNTAPPSWNWKVQQITFGLHYRFLSLPND
jgi:hypothetical protein